MNKKRILTIIAILLVLMLSCYIVYRVALPKNSIDVSLEDINIIRLDYKEIIELPSLNEEEEGFTCTGLTYNVNNNSFFIGNYGKITKKTKKTPSIIQVDGEFKNVKNQIKIDNRNANIQGVSYDNKTDSLWYTDGKYIINCTILGKEIKKFKCKGYERFSPNGVLVDNSENAIWVLCLYNYLLKYDFDGKLLESFKSDYIGQDHLGYFGDGKLCFSVGEDYMGDKNYVAVYSKQYMKIEKAYQVIGSYAIEGIAVVGSTLYIANDGFYHNAKIKKNYIAKYDLSE